MALKLKPTSQIKARLGIDPNGRVQKFFTATCAKHMDKYVPFDEGNLADYRLESNAVVYEQPYARYQYYGIREDGTHKINEANRNRSFHPLATSYWDKKMVSAEMQDVIKEVQDYIGGK
jgi:hypothetical protein